MPTGASAKTHPLVRAEFAKKPQLKRSVLSSECRSARKAYVYYELIHSKWLAFRGVESAVTYSFPAGCAHTLWAAKQWRERAQVAKAAYAKWQDSQYVLHDFAVADGNNAWFKAIDEAQKAYPGTEAWLKSCSSGEGGWGRWVPNSQGSGAGGWMQMMYGTWDTMFHGWYGNEGALSYLRDHGYTVPESADSWHSPLGQALAAAHGKTHGRGSEWYGGGCG